MRMAELDVVINNRYMCLKPCKTEYYYEINNGETYYRLVRNIPFDLNSWMTLVNASGYGAFKLYANQNWGKKYDTIDWKPLHDEWKEIMSIYRFVTKEDENE